MSTSESALPDLRITKKLGGQLAENNLYDVKFYPYNPAGVDPVFATTGGRHTLICRPILGEDGTVEDLRYFEEAFEEGDEEGAGLNSLAWSCAEDTGDPLVCVSGTKYQIKVLNVVTGALVKTLVGHGGAIDDLATSPVSPSILASASEDHSLRLWNLSSEHESEPCVAILAGEGGHRAGVLAVAFHSSGRYLLSGGFDTRVNLWVLPDLPKSKAVSGKTITVHYPHFSTQEVHSDYVDCVAFHGDLIVSRSAKENIILLWKITGFDSENDLPPQTEAPSARGQVETRSGFSDCKSGGGFQVLLTLAAPGTELFYMRFGLFSQPDKHPIIAMGHGAVINEHGRLLSKSCISFWDLQLLEDGIVGYAESSAGGGGGTSKSKSKSKSKSRPSAVMTKVEKEGSSSKASTPNPGETKSANGLKGPFHELLPHKRIDDPMGKPFSPRAVSWSPGGEWCVVVGDHGTICALSRWEMEDS